MASVKRLWYIDNLRIALTALVIVHHAGQAYGPGGWWYFEEVTRAPVLGILFALDRSFFMSLFFMVSGYFLPAAYDHKGSVAFLKDRFLRLGVPILLFFLLVIPVMTYIYYLNFRIYGYLSFWNYYVNIFFGAGGEPVGWTGPSWPDMQFGHLWFLEHLLVYAVCYTIIRMVSAHLRNHSTETAPIRHAPPTDSAILIFALILSIVSMVVRIWYPIDRWVGFLGVIQTAFADVPRDMSFFILGVLAYRNNWFNTFPTRQGYRWLWIGFGLGAAFAAGRLAGLNLRGIYALWESLFCCGMCIGLVVLFRERVNGQNRWSQAMASAAYGAYLYHVPVVVALQYTIGTWHWQPLLKFGLVSLLAIPLSFGVSSLIRKLPLAKSIL